MYSRYHNRTAARRKPHTRRNKRAKIKIVLRLVDRFSGEVERIRAKIESALMSQLADLEPKPFKPGEAAQYIANFLKSMAARDFNDPADYDIRIIESDVPDEDGKLTLTPGNLQTLIMMAGKGAETPPPLRELEGLTEWTGQAGTYSLIDGKPCFAPRAAVERITFTGTFNLNDLKNEDSTEKSD